MTGKRDPLSELFSNVELTGLSNTRRSSSTETPLHLDIPENTEPVEESTKKRRRPMRPPRLDPNDTLESDIELEEMSSEESESESEDVATEASTSVSESESTEISLAVEPSSEPEIDPQEKIRMVLARQARQRNKMAILEQQKQKNTGMVEDSSSSSSSGTTPLSSKPSITSQGERLAKMDAAKTEAPSAMELFMAAVEESKQKKEQRRTNTQSSSRTSSASSISTVTPEVSQAHMSSDSQESTGQPLMGNRLILTVEGMIQSHLPGLKQFHVASALDSFDRRLLKAIWTRYRMKFLISGQLEYAVASLSVVDALETIEDGDLVAAYVETTASDYLIWVDLTHGRLVAAFADAGRYFAN